MSLKKNAVSYVTWMILLLFTGLVFAFLGMIVAQIVSGSMNPLLAAGFIAGFFLVLFLLYVLTGLGVKICKPLETSRIRTKVAPFLEGLVIGLCISAGVAVRISLLDFAGEDAAYYELAKVTEQSGVAVQSVQGSVYYYCMLLHGVFKLFGNNWMAGIWLQIVLQMLGILLFYFAIRKLTDKWPAILVLIFLCISPVSIDAGLNYSPQILYFCIFSLVFLLLADYLSKSGKPERYPVAMWIYSVVLGVLIGFACYVDVAGVLLLLPVLCIGMVKREPGHTVLWFLRTLVIIVSAVCAFGGMILLDSILSGSSFTRVLNAWFVTYSSVGFRSDILTENRQVELLVLIILISIGVFSFWRRKNEERFTLFVLLVIGIGVLHFSGITADNMDGSYLLYALMSALAAVAVMELFYKELMVMRKDKQVKDTSQIELVELDTEEMQNKSETVSIPSEKPRFIENPLPLPRKHIKKIMDFAFIPDEEDMKYDIQVSDSDDFDI